MSSNHCIVCQMECRGKKCRDCFRNNKTNEEPLFNLKDILSSQRTNLDQSGILPNADGKLFSNASFQNGVWSDIEYVVTSENLENTLNTNAGEEIDVQTESFSLIKLVTNMVKREIAPLRKELMEVKAANKILEEEVKAYKAEIEVLAVSNATATASPNANLENVLAPYKEALEKLAPIEKSVKNHQRYLDQDDAKKREMNLIITGVKDDGDNSDIGKVKEIFEATGCGDIVPLKVKRLGMIDEKENTRIRPLLVVTDSAESRKKILRGKAKLKAHSGEHFKTIYVKADEPIAVRKEWKRLRDVMRKEKNAPINQGTTIKIDYKKRELLRNGLVIDKFRSPFQERGPSH